MNIVRSIRSQPVLAVYGIVVLSLVLVATGFIVLGLLPLSTQLSRQFDREITHFLDSSAWQLRAVLDNHVDIASHTASRTAIRKKLLAYDRGEIGLDALVEFSGPKLADGLTASDVTRGIARFDVKGEKVLQLGEFVDSSYYLSAPRELKGVKARGPVLTRFGSRLLYYTPLVEPGYGIIGYDLIVFSDADVRQIVDSEFGNAGRLFLAQDDRILYGNRADAAQPEDAALSAYLAGRKVDERYRIVSMRIEPPGWDLYLVVDMQVFRAPIERKLLQLVLFVAGAVAIVMLLALVVLRPILRAMRRHDQLVHEAHTDSLTGLVNHKYFLQRLEQELSRSMRHATLLSVLFLDLDHFKRINDEYGHRYGDEVLEGVAKILQTSLRKSDLAGRYGGEEFAVILPEIGADAAFVFGERIRRRVAAWEFDVQGEPMSVTISVGVASYRGRGETSAGALLEAADAALYAAKDAGRNTVKLAA